MVTKQKTSSPPNSGRLMRQAAKVRNFLEALGQSAKITAGDGASAFCVTGIVEMVLGRSKHLPITSERELVKYALDFANGDTDRSTFREIYKQVVGKSAKPPDRDIDLIMADNWRAELRHFLSGVVTLPHGITEEAFEDIEKEFRNIWILPRIHRTGNGVRVSNTFLLLDWASFSSYLFALLLDETRPYARDLCRCNLAECGRLFLAVKPATGRPQRLYCDEKHMHKAHALQSTQRARESRARKVRKPK